MHSLIAKNNLILRSTTTLIKVHAYNEPVVKICKKLMKVLTDLQETVNVFRELPGLGAQITSILSKDRIKFLIGVDDACMAISVLHGSEKDDKAKYTYGISGSKLAKWVGKNAQKVQHSRAPKRQHGGNGGGSGQGGKGNNSGEGNSGKKPFTAKKAHFVKNE